MATEQKSGKPHIRCLRPRLSHSAGRPGYGALLDVGAARRPGKGASGAGAQAARFNSAADRLQNQGVSDSSVGAEVWFYGARFGGPL
jgi:hypothetical protein